MSNQYSLWSRKLETSWQLLKINLLCFLRKIIYCFIIPDLTDWFWITLSDYYLLYNFWLFHLNIIKLKVKNYRSQKDGTEAAMNVKSMWRSTQIWSKPDAVSVVLIGASFIAMPLQPKCPTGVELSIERERGSIIVTPNDETETLYL